MNCSICEEPVLEGEATVIVPEVASGHLCCYAYDFAFEVDNTMMCLGVVETSAFQKARPSFQKAFMMTLNLHCQHRKEYKAWPWNTERKQVVSV